MLVRTFSLLVFRHEGSSVLVGIHTCLGCFLEMPSRHAQCSFAGSSLFGLMVMVPKGQNDHPHESHLRGWTAIA